MPSDRGRERCYDFAQICSGCLLKIPKIAHRCPITAFDKGNAPMGQAIPKVPNEGKRPCHRGYVASPQPLLYR